MNEKLKIAVLVGSYTIESWKNKVIDDLRNTGNIEVFLFLIYEKEKRKSFNSLLFRLYERLDRWFFSRSKAFRELPKEENSLAEVNISDVCNSASYDLVINLSDEEPPTAFNKARLGVWSYSFGEENSFTLAPFFKELYDNNPISKSSLKSSINNQEKVLYTSYSSTNPFSLYLNQNKNYWKASEFVLRCLNNPGISRDHNYYNSCDPYPGNFLMIKFFFKLAKRILLQKTKSFFLKEQWFIALTDKFQTFKIIKSNKNRYFADPFLIENNGKNYIFFEDFIYSKNKGVISYIDTPGARPKVVLEKDFHLSYPFIFKDNDKIYMIPETMNNGTIELYEATNFPDKWELKKVLLNNLYAVDTTLFKYHGKYWLFTNIAKNAGYLCDELYLFYADSLLGEWTYHPKNPIVSDVRSARCAGKLFFEDGKLIRPSQETSIRYGYSLNFNKIDILSEKDYKETTIKTTKPEKIRNNLAIHTYNSANGLEIIDGMKITGKYF